MILENWLYNGLIGIQTQNCPPLTKDISCDCLVIGGGFAGLHATLRLIESGKQVVLVEKTICGGSSSGKSGGFLTPQTENDIWIIEKNHGKENGKIIFDIPQKGVDMIVSIIKKYSFKCDLRKQDSMYLAIKERDIKEVKVEAEVRKKAGLPYKLYNQKNLSSIHPSNSYFSGMRFSGSYGINSLAYCQELKNLLIKKGVKIYEGTEVNKIFKNIALTHRGNIKAKNILVCIDKMKTEFDEEISKKYYHVQSFLAVSEPLTKEEKKQIFPKEELMCWDSNDLYLHYRIVENDRIMLGGQSYLTIFSPNYSYSPKVINNIIAEFKDRFPFLKNLNFTHFWPGLLDVTKDLNPIADYHPRNKSIQYTLGCAGLPWAAFCGDYIARRVVNPKTEDLSGFLGINRKFFISDNLQKYLGKVLSFSISNLRSIY